MAKKIGTTVDTKDTKTTKENKNMKETTEETKVTPKTDYIKAKFTAEEAAKLTPAQKLKAITDAGFSQERAQSVLHDLIESGELVLEGEAGAVQVMELTAKRVFIPDAAKEEVIKKIQSFKEPIVTMTLKAFKALSPAELASTMTSDATQKLMVSVERSRSTMLMLMTEGIYIATPTDMVRFTNNKIEVEGVEKIWNSGSGTGRAASPVSVSGFKAKVA